VAAMDLRTGALLVSASSPSYNPNLVEGKFGLIGRIQAPCSRPAALVNRVTDGLYAPGSTFKVVTAAAALESGKFTIDSTFYDPGYCEVYGKRVNNYDTSSPFGRVTLLQGMEFSINSVFCNIGKQLGAKAIVAQSKKFGFYERPPLETPENERAPSGLYKNGKPFDPKEDFQVDPGRFAFGQERLLVTPLQMAMVAAAIGNRGSLMKPYVVDRIVSSKGKTVLKTKPKQLEQAVKPATADTIRTMMEAVVAGGTGTAARIPGLVMGGKTGTAETGVTGRNTTWFICYAGRKTPEIAVAVVLEEQTGGTGGRLSAPVAREVVQALLPSTANS
jgi:penicillin-binding protein A